MYEQTKKIWENESYKEGLERPPPTIKEFVHVRIEIRGPMLDNPGKIPFFNKLSVYFMNLTVSYYAELCPSIGRVRVKHRGVLLTLKGTVIRSGSIKMIEGEREYECRKCKKRLLFIKLLFSIAIKHYYL